MHWPLQRSLLLTCPFMSDNGGEYTSKQYANLMVKNKIRHEFSAPYSPHLNGTAERAWKTLYNVARSLLFQSNLPKELWTYAVRHATFIRNRCYSRQLEMTPFEKFLGQQPNLSNMYQFGVTCFSHNVKASKLEKRGQEGQYIGQDTHSAASLVYHKDKNVVVKARSVVYFSKVPHDEVEDPEEEDYYLQFPMAAPQDENVSPVSEGESIVETVDVENPSPPPQNKAKRIQPEKKNVVNSGTVPNQSSRYPSRTRKPPKYLDQFVVSDESDEYHDISYISNSSIDYFCRVSNIPVTYEQAVKSDDYSNWKVAMDAEMNALEENHTYQLVSKPSKKVIGGRWVYCTKNNEHGQEIYKARYVAKGFSQVKRH